MKRGVFETLFISALAYTVVASAAMPTRAQETVVYPTIPYQGEKVDGLLDKMRKSILTHIRECREELRNGQREIFTGDYLDTFEGTGETEPEQFGDDQYCEEPAGPFASEWEDSGTVEEVEGTGDDRADTVLTYIGTYTCTGYCACSQCCGEYSSGYTASGTWATEGRTIACNSLPMGTEVVIDGNTYIVEDTGWSPYGEAWIDIFFEDHQRASDFGVQTKEVYVWE